MKPRVIRKHKLIYQDVGWDTTTWRKRLVPGFLPACAEHGGRFRNAAGLEDSFYVGGYHGPRETYDFAKVADAARSFPPRTLFVIDEEETHQSYDSRKMTPEMANARERRQIAWAHAMREANPRLRVAAYDQIVNSDYWMLTRQHEAGVIYRKWAAGSPLSAYEAWAISRAYRKIGDDYVLDDTIGGAEGRAAYLAWKQAGTDATQGEFSTGRVNKSAGVEDAMDAITPSLYDYYEGDDTAGRTVETIGECRRIAGGRAVLPYVWPLYHNSHPTLAGTPIPAAEWRAHVGRILRLADGLVVWGADADAHAEHFRIVQEEAADAEHD